MFGIDVFHFQHALKIRERLLVLMSDLPRVANLAERPRLIVAGEFGKNCFVGCARLLPFLGFEEAVGRFQVGGAGG